MSGVFALLSALSGAVGSIFNLGSTIRQNELSKVQDQLNAALLEENTMNSYQAQFVQNWSSWRDAIDNGDNISAAIDSNKLSLLQQNQTIDAFNQYLTRWQDAYSSNSQNLKQEGKNTYYQLMQQRAEQTLNRLALGHTGGSSSLIEKMARDQIADFAGEDMELDSNGGTFGQTLKDFFLDSLADLNETKGQKEIEEQSWDKTYEALQDEYKNYENSIAVRDEAFENMQSAFDKMVNFYDVDSAKDNYIKELQSYQNYATTATDADLLNQEWRKLEAAYTSYKDLTDKRNDALSGFTSADLTFLNSQASEYGYTFNGWTDTFSTDTSTFTELQNSFKNLYNQLYVPEDNSDDDYNWAEEMRKELAERKAAHLEDRTRGTSFGNANRAGSAGR